MPDQSNSNTQLNESEIPTHYIGVGASVVGLKTLQTLIQNLPTDTGACFVVVQHFSPDLKSILIELLSKHTTMDIQNANDDVFAKPNTIYLLPQNETMIVSQGKLLLSDKIPYSELNFPIDVFFKSLAEDQQHRAIGIILSGTGSDGSRGLKELKEVGAFVIAQDPDSAKFDGMSNSAIQTGIVDLILRSEDMGAQLAKYIRHPLVNGERGSLQEDMKVSQDLMGEILNILRIKSNIDFSKYKPSTIARRVERRMTIKHINSLQDYLILLFKDSYEVQVLSKELLIGVTRFFRDSEAFQSLTDKVIPKLVSESVEKKVIRVWVAACSSGEEAYSIALLINEEIIKQGLKRQLKVFATDVNADAITEAGTGNYSGDVAYDIKPELLAKYFTAVPTGGYQVKQAVRQMVVFSTHNMITDPPFSNIDLVTCRNVLIYFQESAQKRVTTSFNLALKKHGFLFLGSSENLGELALHFHTISERQKIYQKTSDVQLNISNSPQAPSNKKASSTIPSVSSLMKNYRGSNPLGTSIGFANESLITQYVPPCILLNDDYEALHVYGDTSAFVKRLPPGRISAHISDMVSDDISIAVLSALQLAKQKGEEVYYTGMQTTSGEDIVELNLRVRYLKEHDLSSAPGYFWIVFETIDSEENNSAKKVKFDLNGLAKQRIEDLELNKEQLQETIKELELINEQLQSANEELLSSNLALQSKNEKLQSINEELYTVNSEYQEKITEISQGNGGLDEI
jgi:two-component system CheB/CheR fusion protein